MTEPSLIMATVSEIAERDGISKQAVSAALAKIIADHADFPVERDSRGRLARVSLAHWDHLRAKYTNPARRPKPQPIASANEEASFNEARRRNEWLKLQTNTLDFQEKAGQLVRADRLHDALAMCGREIRAIIDRLPNQADRLAMAGAREGQSAIRSALREIAFEVGTAIADKLAEIGTAAPEHDPLIDDTSQDGEAR